MDHFEKDQIARPALPLLLDREIHGIGFALACDFVKELGCENFGKPDVHVKKVFRALDLSSGQDDFTVFKDIVRVSRNAGQTPYNVDKIFWLIGSGDFYLDGFRIRNHRDGFIWFARPKLKSYAAPRSADARAARA